MKIVYTLSALEDLSLILQYIEKEDKGAAKKVASSIKHIEYNIKLFPGAARYNVKTDTYERCVPNTHLIIIYHIKSTKTIEIIAVFHTSRNPKIKESV